MISASFGFGPFLFSTLGVFLALAFFTASFLLWRSLRDDYPEEEILTLTILATLFALGGGRIFFVLDHFSDFNFDLNKWLLFTRFPGFSPIGGFLAASFFVYYYTLKKHWDFWLVADHGVWAYLSIFFIGLLGAVVSQPVLPMVLLGRLGMTLFSFFLVFFLKQNYRKFIWYQSGKPGFIACAVTVFYFFGMSLLDFWTGIVLYWEIGGALTVTILSLVLLYQRSGRVLKKDWSVLGSFLGRRIKKET